MKIPKKNRKTILAFGTDGKGKLAFAKEGAIRFSEDFGNLQDAKSFERYERAIKCLIKKERPDILACDMHPDYNSTKLALSLQPLLSSLRKQGSISIDSRLRGNDKINQLHNNSLKLVQHHHAHIASCMFDNNLTGRVIGIAFDGTGYGTDANIWGGEFFAGWPKSFKRVNHLEYIPMPGGEMAIKEPWRMAVAYLYKYFGAKFLNLKIPFIKSIAKDKAVVLKKMIENNINSPETSSAGRLFDAAGALINLTNYVGFEGESAIKLEKLARLKEGRESSFYKGPLIRGVVKDLERGIDKELAAIRFHNSLAWFVFDTSKKLAKKYKIKKVVLSGGVFQNKVLLEKTKALFEGSGLSLYTHKNIPATDAGISAGQAFIVTS